MKIKNSKITNNGVYLICIAVRKSAYSVIGQLAANKNNQTFLPLDPNPKQWSRNKLIIEDAKPHWFLFDNSDEHNAYAHENKLICVFEDNQSNIKLWSINKEMINYDRKKMQYHNDCRYLIYSSGTTGNPKGILLRDEPVVEVVREQAKEFKINEKTKFAWVLNPAFDASLSDIYTTLLSGGELHILSFAMNKIKKLTQYIEKNNITHSDLSPSIIPMMKKIGIPKSLKCIIFGGELASEYILKEIAKNNIELFNAYGPTETTICSSFSKVNNEWTASNIGQSIKNVLYKIIDNELHIGGNHLAIQYKENAYNKELNKRFYEQDGIRWYKTGDQVKEKENVFYYAGRLDNQFKYHGQLICSEEIENAAYQCGVETSACVYDDNQQKIHLFYVSLIDKELLRKELGKYLASYMIPHYFHQELKLPQNNNGKIDIKKLKFSIINKN